VEWLGELSCNILFEDKYSAARAMKALSEELPSPPPIEESMTDTDATNPVEAPEEVERTDTTKPDLGNMGWRMCHHALRKVRPLSLLFLFDSFLHCLIALCVLSSTTFHLPHFLVYPLFGFDQCLIVMAASII
jgi:hypothetical protein